jgi:predicted RNA-binding Zn-ribbon protein involved in translation (DUF1610 family)
MTDLEDAVPAKYDVGQAVRMRTSQPDYVSGPVVAIEPREPGIRQPVYTIDLYGGGPAHRIRALESQIMAADEPVKAPPRVGKLPCPKCGDPDTSMRWCAGGYSIQHGHCTISVHEHFHRGCPNCGHRWLTYDVLDAATPIGPGTLD